MDDLISRKAAIDQAMGKLDYTDVVFDTATESEIVYMLRSLPSVPAVPLEPLCEWLEKVAGKPCHESCAGCEDDVSGNGYKECWERMIREEVCNGL